MTDAGRSPGTREARCRPGGAQDNESGPPRPPRFEAYKDRVARQVFRMTGDASSVDDLVQEVFISAFSAIGRFRGDAQLGTWLYTIAANRVRNWWDSQRRRRRREDIASASTPVTTPSPGPRPDFEASSSSATASYRALGELLSTSCASPSSPAQSRA